MNMSQLEFFGKQGTKKSYIKTYPSLMPPIPLFFYQNINNVTYITPINPNIDVLFKKNLIVNGTIYGTLSTPSDARLKQNITSVDTSISNKILDLSPKQYTYINNPNDTIHYGLLAQDVELVYPSLVKNDGNENIKSVNYIELIPLLIDQVKSLQRQIDEIKNNI